MDRVDGNGDGAPVVYRERADSHATSSVGSWDSEQLPWYRRAVNLLSSVALMMVIAVATCTVISSVFLYTSMNSGLEETRSSCDRGINEIRTVAGVSLDYVGTYMMEFSATSIKNSVTSYVESGFVVCLHLNMVVTDLLGHLPKNETVFYDSAAKWLWQEGMTGDHIRRHGHASTYTVIGMYYGNTGQGVSFGTSVQAWPGREWAPTAYETRDDITMIGPALNITGQLDPVYRRPFVIRASQIATLRVMQEGLMKPGEMKMTQLEIVGGFLGYPMGIQIQDPISPRILQGIVWIGMKDMQAFLQTLAASANTTKARPRIFCLIRRSWIADAFKAKNDPSWVDYDQVGYLTGTSHGNATNNTWGWDPVRQGFRINSKPTLAVDAEDVLTRNIARHLEQGVGYENASLSGIRNANIVDSTNASAPDNYQFVGVFPLSKPHEGLDWWLVMSMDAEAILAEVAAQAIQTSILIEKDRERVQSKINRDVRNTVLAVVGAAVFVLVISCVLVMLLLRPLTRVQKAMRRVARMDLEGLEITADSNMCEVRQMQGDFMSMVEALLEFRAYVPSSLLGSSGGISRAIDPPSGNVAVMFTDIQQSTALWKRNSEDMNEALEMHNQVIRSACGPTEGYEVKTIGDAFMVSFQSAEAAMRCALDIQTRLAEEEWPERLGLTRSGLVIRIGINYGSTISEENPVTGRVDYRGSTINMASRLEAKALGGTICISSDMYATIRPDLPGLGDPLVRPFGNHDLKGLGEHQLYIMVPQHMKRRLTPETSDCNPPSADHLRQKSSLSFEKSSQLSSGGLGESLARLNRKQEKAANSKTGLKVNRDVITMGICTTVCEVNRANPPRCTHTSHHTVCCSRKRYLAVRQLQYDGSRLLRLRSVDRGCRRQHQRLHTDYPMERFEAVPGPRHGWHQLRCTSAEAHWRIHEGWRRDRMHVARQRWYAEEPFYYSDGCGP